MLNKLIVGAVAVTPFKFGRAVAAAIVFYAKPKLPIKTDKIVDLCADIKLATGVGDEEEAINDCKCTEEVYCGCMERMEIAAQRLAVEKAVGFLEVKPDILTVPPVVADANTRGIKGIEDEDGTTFYAAFSIAQMTHENLISDIRACWQLSS